MLPFLMRLGLFAGALCRFWAKVPCSYGPPENCRFTGCCEEEGKRCYMKDRHYAQCRSECTPGPQQSDPVKYRTPWSCTELNPELLLCSERHGDCSHSHCCVNPEDKCYEKDEYYAKCLPTCKPGVHEDDGLYKAPWSCEVVTQSMDTKSYDSRRRSPSDDDDDDTASDTNSFDRRRRRSPSADDDDDDADGDHSYYRRRRYYYRRRRYYGKSSAAGMPWGSVATSVATCALAVGVGTGAVNFAPNGFDTKNSQASRAQANNGRQPANNAPGKTFASITSWTGKSIFMMFMRHAIPSKEVQM